MHLLQRISVVEGIVLEKNLIIFVDNHYLGGSRARVDTEIAIHFGIRFYLFGSKGYYFFVIFPVNILFFVTEKRWQSIRSRAVISLRQFVSEFRQIKLRLRCLCQKSTTPSGEEFAVFGQYYLIVAKRKQCLKSITQSRYKCERSADTDYLRHHLVSANKSSYRLVGNGLEDRHRQIGQRYIACNKILYVGLGKYSTPRGYGIYFREVPSFVVQFADRYTYKVCHLVYESTCTTGTRAVHSYVGLFAFCKKDYLGIFATQIYKRMRIWVATLGYFDGSYDLLMKRNM